MMTLKSVSDSLTDSLKLSDLLFIELLSQLEIFFDWIVPYDLRHNSPPS